MPTRQEVLTWNDVVALVDHLLPQMLGTFDAPLLITRGGIIPGDLTPVHGVADLFKSVWNRIRPGDC